MNMRKMFLLLALLGGSLMAYGCENASCYDPVEFPINYALDFCAQIRAEATPPCLDPRFTSEFESYGDPKCRERAWWAHQVCMTPTDKYYDSQACIAVRAILDLQALEDAGVDGAMDPDAGADDGGDAGADAQSAWAGHCVDNHPDFYMEPQPVWFGLVDQAPKECASNVGAFGSRGYFDLHKPTTEGCAKCVCGDIEGSCPKDVGTILFRAGKCDELQVATTDFSPPDNWDGSCAANHAITQDAECPANSGIKCLQSTYMSALAKPIEGCKPVEIPIPKAITDAPKWTRSALSCTAPSVQGSSQDQICFEFPKDPGWRTCVHAQQRGIYDCIVGSKYSERIVVYPEDAIIDHRSCSACTCEASGGSCYGSVRYYQDNACSVMLAQETLSSTGSECHNFYPPGAGIGSKDMGEPLYVAGSCEPKGGVPVGDIELDETNAVTWCCLEKEPEEL